ncbi:MAG: hypothetical protein JWL72_2957, partial [Ilumatobacteraceae bacterium]|nr:hypothetical protein [Ilumatobacteraceae bacterium]
KVVDTRVVSGVTQHLFLRACPRSIQGVWVSQVPVTKLGEMSTDYLRQRLPKPAFGTAPASTKGVVNVDMWIWTDPATFKPISVTAWVPTQTGIAQATTTAKPTRISYSPGEPGSNTVTCNGFGEVWHSNYPDDAKSSCMYAYRHSSEIDPSGTFHAELNIVWGVRWTSNVATGKTLPDVVTTADAAMTVREIEALVVG